MNLPASLSLQMRAELKRSDLDCTSVQGIKDLLAKLDMVLLGSKLYQNVQRVLDANRTESCLALSPYVSTPEDQLEL